MDRSPYAPPSSDIDSGASGALAGTLPLDTVDLGAALSWPMKTPDWWKRCLIPGLFVFVPFVGMIALTGWMRRIFDQVRTGDPGELPEFDFGGDLGRGWRPFGALFFTAMGLYFIIAVLFGGAFAVGAGISAVSADAGEVAAPLFMIVAQLVYMVVLLGFNVYMTEVWRIGLGGGLFPPARIGETVRAIKAAPMPFVITAVGIFVAGMIGSIGVFACFIGMVVTLPMAWAMMAHLVGQWERVVRSKLGPA
jgi:hypothetical protein